MPTAGGRGTAGSRHARLHAHTHPDASCTMLGERQDVPRIALHVYTLCTMHCACQSLTVLGVRLAHASTALH